MVMTSTRMTLMTTIVMYDAEYADADVGSDESDRSCALRTQAPEEL